MSKQSLKCISGNLPGCGVGHVYDIVYIAVGASLSFLELGCCLISTSSRFLCCSCALIVAGTLMLDADFGRQPDALCSRSGDSDSLP